MKNPYNKINNLLNELGIENKIKSNEELLRLIQRTNTILIRKTQLESHTKFLEKIDQKNQIFIEIFRYFHDFLFQLGDKNYANDLMNELSYALWSNKDIFYDKNNFEFVKFIVNESIQLNLNAHNPNSAMEKYIELTAYFHVDSSRSYSDIFKLSDLLDELEILWENNYNNPKWGVFFYYIPKKEFYFDNVGALGNLAYLRWSIRKDLNLFDKFESEFDFVIDEIYEIINNNSPTIGVYFFFEFFWISKYYLEIDNNLEYYNKFLNEIAELANLIEVKYPRYYLTLSKFFKEASIIALDINYFKKQNIYWEKFIESIYNNENKHGKYIFTIQHLDKLEENNLVLNQFLNEIKKRDAIKNFKIASKICWKLTKSYKEIGIESWAIKMIMSLESLKFKKKKKLLIKKRSLIFKRTILEYLSKKDSSNIGVEYYLSRNNFLFNLDRYIVYKILSNNKKIKFLEEITNNFLKELNYPFLLAKYYDLIIDISLKLRDYDTLNKYLEVILLNKDELSLEWTEIIYYNLLKSQYDLIKRFSKNNILSLNREKEKINNSIEKSILGTDLFSNLKKKEIIEKRDLVFLYLEVLQEILDLLNFLKRWHSEITTWIRVISSEWQNEKRKYLLNTFKLELIIFDKSFSNEFIKFIFIIKKGYTFIYKLGLMLEDIVKEELPHSIFKKESSKLYYSFSKDDMLFSTFLNCQKTEDDVKNIFSRISIQPFIIPLKYFSGFDENPKIKMVDKKVDNSGKFLLLKYIIPKDIICDLVKYPFLYHPEEKDIRNLMIKNIQFGIIWLENKLPLKTELFKLDKIKVKDDNFLISISIGLTFEFPNNIYIIPFIESSIFSKKIYGKKEYINLSNFITEDLKNDFLIRIDDTKPEINITLEDGSPTLEFKLYILIMDIILNLSLTIERLPKTFKKLKEPEIRDIILIILNAIFKGRAIGETFNKKGKTDILIRYENQNLFIAECKFWGGPEKLKETINQLFDYIVWRDTKVSIIIFNKGIKFSTVLKKIDPTLKAHPCYKKEYIDIRKKLNNKETIFGYVFKHPDDEEKEIYLTILAFNIQ